MPLEIREFTVEQPTSVSTYYTILLLRSLVLLALCFSPRVISFACSRSGKSKRGFAELITRAKIHARHLIYQVTIVTGPGTGIDRIVPRVFAAEQAHVVCADLDLRAPPETEVETSVPTHERIHRCTEVKIKPGVRKPAEVHCCCSGVGIAAVDSVESDHNRPTFR